MRKTFAPALVLTLLALGAAGVAWAVQTGVEAPRDAAEAAPAPAAEASPLAEGNASGEISLEGLFPEPAKMQGGCCFANCRAELNACQDACGGNQTCLALCAEEYEACKASC